MTRLVLVHGAASTPGVWVRLLPLLAPCEVLAPERPRTGDLDHELAWLEPLVRDAWVVGASGGATLGLALAARGVSFAGAVLHEPAVGSLVPELLDPMVSAFSEGGTEAFARVLYGPSWSVDLCGDGAWLGDDVTARELGMFRGFEPASSAAAGPVLTTVGANSPVVRHRAADLLRSVLGYQVAEVPGASHFAPYDAAENFAAIIRGFVVEGWRGVAR